MKYTFGIFLCFSFFLISCSSSPAELPALPEEEVTEEVSLGFEGAGTEPFWAFRFTGGSLNWQEPGETETLSYTASGSATLDETNQNISIVAGDFLATLIPDVTCSDGMSENLYAYKVLLQKDTRSFSGCAREYIGEL